MDKLRWQGQEGSSELSLGFSRQRHEYMPWKGTRLGLDSI